MRDERITRLIQEAETLRYSRRTALKRAVALGLSVPVVSAALNASAAQAAAPGIWPSRMSSSAAFWRPSDILVASFIRRFSAIP